MGDLVVFGNRLRGVSGGNSGERVASTQVDREGQGPWRTHVDYAVSSANSRVLAYCRGTP